MTEKNSQLEAAIEFADNPEPRCPCVLLLDTSGSMQGAPIEALSQGLKVFKEDLCKDGLASRRVELAVVTFDSDVKVVQDFVTADQFQPPTLTPRTTAKRQRWPIWLAAALVMIAVYSGCHRFSSPGRPAGQGAKQTPVAKKSTPGPVAQAPVQTPTVVPEPKPAQEAVQATAAVAGQNLVVADLGMEMVSVEPGSFQMGSDSGDSDEKPVHTVRISRPFWMAKYEVTQSQYQAVTGTNPSYDIFKGSDLPVDSVSWNDAVAFCRKLTERERQAGRLPQGYVYRLPTEAEWEYAARGGGKSRGFEYAGSGSLDEVAWHSGNSGFKTHPVGQKKPNELGLYDMSGNVWEWCHDLYDAGYYAKSPASDPTGASSGGLRVLRGGSQFNRSPRYCRSSNRLWISPVITPVITDVYFDYGFRLVASWPLD